VFIILRSLTIRFLIVFFLKFLAFLISEKSPLMREELSSFECGFEHHSLSRVPFSLRYFFLTLIFLLFDLEIVLIMFLPSLLFSSSFVFSILVLGVFIIFLYIGLIYEWQDGSLEWVNLLNNIIILYMIVTHNISSFEFSM